MQGWAASENCFHRQDRFKGNHHGEYTGVLFENPQKLVAALQAGEVRHVRRDFACHYQSRGKALADISKKVYTSLGTWVIFGSRHQKQSEEKSMEQGEFMATNRLERGPPLA